MCGIAGIVNPEIRRHENRLQRMIDALRHRGPDGDGMYFFDDCALGHRRLAIVDLQKGHQPMLSPVSKSAVIFNGEIYGYKDIKSSITNYPFKTTSDTELILSLYDSFEYRLLEKLPGMFAFALWDDSKKRLFCARDRFGEKPFYYAFGNNGEFLFASEIKALIASGLITPELDEQSLLYYMKYLYIPTQQTVYKNIFSLPPAHFLVLEKGRVSVERYWKLPKISGTISLTDAGHEFKRLFEQAIERQLVADVEVGAFLSGGLDSTTVVAVASRKNNKLKTFSFGFKNSIFNELPYASEAAKSYKTDHIEFNDEGVDLGELMVQMQNVYDEPFADSSNMPTYLISKFAREHVRVVLSGDGGDELLAGYHRWYRPLYNMQKMAASTFTTMLVEMLTTLNDRLRWRALQTRLHSYEQGISYVRAFESMSDAHYHQKRYFTEHDMMSIGIADHAGSRAPMSPAKTLDEVLRIDIEDYLPGDILVKTDRASMANGLELRTPYLDVDFASFCIALPSSLKIDGKGDKLLLREAYSQSWPALIRKRRKWGFGAPVKFWLKDASLKNIKDRFLNDPSQNLFSFVSFEGSRQIVNNDDDRTWILLVLAIWLHRREIFKK